VTSYLLDTNVLSELRRPKPDARVRAFVAAQPLERLYVSSVSLAELRFGIEAVAEPKRRTELNAWLTNRVRPMFGKRVIEVSEDVMFAWRVLVEHGRKQRHAFSQPDLIIAASVLCHGLTLVTRNVRDYAKAKVPMFNPWSD
jgi:predicted nucleic acid-binding protein